MQLNLNIISLYTNVTHRKMRHKLKSLQVATQNGTCVANLCDINANYAVVVGDIYG